MTFNDLWGHTYLHEKFVSLECEDTNKSKSNDKLIR